jgi:bacteriocin-like protein
MKKDVNKKASLLKKFNQLDQNQLNNIKGGGDSIVYAHAQGGINITAIILG